MLLQILFYTHHLTTLLFGVFLSAFFLGVNRDWKNIGILLLSALASGLLCLISIFLIGTAFSDEIYPFVVHLPLLLILVFYYKFRWLQSLTSILTAYLCCQYSNWAGIFVLTLTHQEWCYYLCRILVTLIVFFLLCRYLCPTTALLFEKSDRELIIICSMPFVYYLFDYATTKFSTLLYSGSKVVSEFMGFALCLAYLLFLLIYFREYELKSRTEQYNELINMQLRSLRSEIEQAKKSEHNMSILRHDMRPHLSIILTQLQNGHPDKAQEYIQELSRVLRYTLQGNDSKSVCVKDEIEFVSAYIFLLKMRFEDNLSFDICIDNKYANYYLPPMAVQMLIENAVKHNEISDRHPLNIRIYTEGEELIVTNPVQPKLTVTTGTGIGLANLAKRYYLLYKREIQISENEQFTIRIPLIPSVS